MKDLRFNYDALDFTVLKFYRNYIKVCDYIDEATKLLLLLNGVDMFVIN